MKWFARFDSSKKSAGEAPDSPEPSAEEARKSGAPTVPPPPNAAAAGPKPRGRFGFLDAKRQGAGMPSAPASPPPAPRAHPSRQDLPDRGLLPGSDGEHALQCEYGAEARAHGFYTRQVLDYLSPAMRDFIPRQEFLFVATADRHGECDCTSKFGRPGFIRVLGEKYLIYPEYRGNGVFANLGNLTPNPHIAMLIIDFCRDTVGLHVNGKARIVENEDLLDYREQLPADVLEEIAREGKKQPERWVMEEVEEAYIQCSKHIPLMKKLDKRVDWGTDNVVAKGGDYFRLQDIPLYDRVGGDQAMEKAVDVFYRRVLQDDLVGRFFEDVDLEAQRLKQKSFLAMAFGGPYQYTGKDMREVHRHLVEKMGLTDEHFDRVIAHFRDSVLELHVPEPEVQSLCEILESFRDDVLNR